jgi:DNA-binding transcriptional MerR regulator
MPYARLSTSKIARLADCHPNTVRLYEVWGLLPPVERSPKGYRLYTPAHAAQMVFARTALNTVWPGRPIRRSTIALVKKAATGDLGGALEMAYRHLAIAQAELVQAEIAASLVERWAQGAPTESRLKPLRMRQAAELLNITTDTLRNWERNGLIDIPRDEHNGYRQIGGEEVARLRVIRMLRSSGYSTMSILRMLSQLEEDRGTDIRRALDTPREDEDIAFAADRWVTTLRQMEALARRLIEMLEERVAKNC